MEDYIKINFEKRNDLIDKRGEAFESWMKGIVTVATGLIAVLISLKSKVSQTHEQHVAFSATLILLGNGILFGTACLHRTIASLDRHRKAVEGQINEQLMGRTSMNISFAGYPNIYKIFSVIAVLSFLLALIALVGYAIYVDK